MPAGSAVPVRVRDRRTIRMMVSLAVVVAVFCFALPKVASISDVWTQIRDMSVVALVILLVAAAWNLVTYAFVLRVATPGLTYTQAVVVTESSTAVANTMPAGGALGVGVTAAMYRSWGFGASTTSSAVLLTGIWNTLVKLGLPILALGVLATQGHASLARLSASLIGVGVLAVTVGGIVMLLHSDDAARRAGGLAAQGYSQLRRLVRRPAVTGWKDAASEFRTRLRLLLRRSWLRLTIFTVVSQLSLYVVLLLAVRGTGIPSSQVSWAEVLAAFAFVRLLSTIPLTPGGLGVVELGLTGALVGFGGDKASVVAAVLLFRALTYLAPIVFGSLTYFVWRHRSTWRMPVEPSHVPLEPSHVLPLPA
jgi:putative heme transporter